MLEKWGAVAKDAADRKKLAGQLLTQAEMQGIDPVGLDGPLKKLPKAVHESP